MYMGFYAHSVITFAFSMTKLALWIESTLFSTYSFSFPLGVRTKRVSLHFAFSEEIRLYLVSLLDKSHAKFHWIRTKLDAHKRR